MTVAADQRYCSQI
jgi:hypothetical protein